jgi:hypothetical protein
MISKLFYTLIVLLFVFSISPATAQAATYYLSPTGSDAAAGSANSPWKTITKADSTVSTGDIIILKNGIYPAYQQITKSNTTWKAENKHQAILDGDFRPEQLNGNWANIVAAYKKSCIDKGYGTYITGLNIIASDVIIDGVYVRNSCGRGIGIGDNGSNNTIQNSRTDWTMIAALYISKQAGANNKYLNNIFTRMSFNDKYEIEIGNKYSVNISAHMHGNNTLIKGNIFAWGRGEVAIDKGSDGVIVEDNLMVGNKNNLYIVRGRNAIIRNNISYAPELNNGWLINRTKGFGIRNENPTRPEPVSENISVYNNLFVNVSIGVDGGAKVDGVRVDVEKTENVYFAHNTLVAAPKEHVDEDIKLFTINGTGDGSAISGIIENNIFDTQKNPDAIINIVRDNNVVLRNNLLPNNAPASMKGVNDVYANDSGVINALAKLNITPPPVGITTIDTNILLTALNLNNYRLKSTSPAINAGNTTISSVGSISGNILKLAKAEDYSRALRVGVPDIGAFEFNGISGPTMPPAENWDLDDDNDVDVFDFNQFMVKVMKKTESWSKLSSFIAAFQ